MQHPGTSIVDAASSRGLDNGDLMVDRRFVAFVSATAIVLGGVRDERS